MANPESCYKDPIYGENVRKAHALLDQKIPLVYDLHTQYSSQGNSFSRDIVELIGTQTSHRFPVGVVAYESDEELPEIVTNFFKNHFEGYIIPQKSCGVSDIRYTPSVEDTLVPKPRVNSGQLELF